MQIGQLAFEQYMGVAGSGDVAGTPGPGAGAAQLLCHRGQHLGVLAHAEIIVRAPYRDFGADAVIVGAREPAAAPLQIREDTIAPLAMERVDPRFEKVVEIHF